MATNGLAERIGVEEYYPREKIAERAPESPAPKPALTQPKINFITAIGGAFTAIALVLSVRLLLLLSIFGAFYLGGIAMQVQSVYTLMVLAVFCAFTIPVLVYLDIQTRKRG